VMTRLHAEVSRTINFYRSQQGGSQPTLVLLAGGSSVIPHTNTFLKDKLKVDVDYLNPFRNASVSERISTEAVGRDLHLLGETVGVALRRIHSCPVEINLMPRELVRRKTSERRLPFFAMAAFGLILITLVWWVYFQQVRMTTTTERLNTVRTKVQALSETDHALKQILAQKKVVYDNANDLVSLVRSRTQWIEIMETIHSKVSDGMWLVSTRPMTRTEGSQGEKTISYIEIKGMAFSDKIKIEGASEFAAALKGQGRFSDDVQVKRVKPLPGTDYVIEFLIEVVLKDPDKT
jgi:type IV pilus assembly protein PilM